MSTNGLALPEHVGRLVDLGVEHVTVTVNMVDPAVGERIYPWVLLDGKRLEGREASRVLSDRQLAGIEALVARGVLVKVNSVVIPGVNDEHLPAVSRKVRSLGAFLHNVMPLVVAPEHGTHYGLTGQRAPTAAELERVQTACAGDARVMRHCRQCRADAVGLLGQDVNQDYTLDRLGQRGLVADGGPERARHRAQAEGRQACHDAARAAAMEEAAARVPAGLSVRVAVATKGEGVVNQHFGHAREFQVYEASRSGVRLIGLRRVEHYCRGGEGEDDAMAAILGALDGCAAVLVAKVGRCPREALEAAGVEAIDRFAYEPIEAAVLTWLREHAAARCAKEDGSPAAREVA